METEEIFRDASPAGRGCDGGIGLSQEWDEVAKPETVVRRGIRKNSAAREYTRINANEMRSKESTHQTVNHASNQLWFVILLCNSRLFA
jgi:hypothetical protein